MATHCSLPLLSISQQFKEKSSIPFELKLLEIVSSVLYTHTISLEANPQIIIGWQSLKSKVGGLPIGDLGVDKLERQHLGS